MATLRPSLVSRSTRGWYGASLAPGATATPNSAPSAGVSGASGGPPAAPAGPGAGTPTATTSNTAAQLRARTTKEYARNNPFGQPGHHPTGTFSVQMGKPRTIKGRAR